MEVAATVTSSEIERLEQERQATLQKMKNLRNDLLNTAERSADEADTDAFEREKTLALVQSLERKLESIEHAIHSAQKGTYGICETCGDRIDPARLEILPQAIHCLKCQREFERRNHRRRR